MYEEDMYESCLTLNCSAAKLKQAIKSEDLNALKSISSLLRYLGHITEANTLNSIWEKISAHIDREDKTDEYM